MELLAWKRFPPCEVQEWDEGDGGTGAAPGGWDPVVGAALASAFPTSSLNLRLPRKPPDHARAIKEEKEI